VERASAQKRKSLFPTHTAGILKKLCCTMKRYSQ